MSMLTNIASSTWKLIGSPRIFGPYDWIRSMYAYLASSLANDGSVILAVRSVNPFLLS